MEESIPSMFPEITLMDAPPMTLTEQLKLKHKLGIKTDITEAEQHELASQPEHGLNQKQVVIKKAVATQFWFRRFDEARRVNWMLIAINAMF